MLTCIVATDGAVHESTWKCFGVGNVEKICDVERRRRLTVHYSDGPALWGEASMSGTNVALCVRTHVCKAGMPEVPDVLLVRDGLGM